VVDIISSLAPRFC